MNKKLIWGIVIAVVIIAAGVWYMKAYPSFDGKNMPPLNVDNSVVTSDWKTYTNVKYNFTLQYPPTWTLDGVEESPVAIQERASLSFRNSYSNLILFSVVLNQNGGYTVTNPTPYTIPAESKAAYDTVLTTIKLASGTSPTPLAPFSVVTPKAGDVLKSGQKVNITWINRGFELDKILNIYLMRTDETSTSIIAKDAQNKGTFEWTVPVGLKGTYIINLHLPESGKVDSIDNPYSYSSGEFTITN